MAGFQRTTLQDGAIRFRLSDTLIAAAEERARLEGTSVSELLRHALRRELRETPLTAGHDRQHARVAAGGVSL